MLHSPASARSSSPWFLLVLALLAVLAAPSSGGIALSLAAVFLAGVAGFAAGNGELARAPSHRSLVGYPALLSTHDVIELERVYSAFDDTATMRLNGAIARLRAPRSLSTVG